MLVERVRAGTKDIVPISGTISMYTVSIFKLVNINKYIFVAFFSNPDVASVVNTSMLK